MLPSLGIDRLSGYTAEAKRRILERAKIVRRGRYGLAGDQNPDRHWAGVVQQPRAPGSSGLGVAVLEGGGAGHLQRLGRSSPLFAPATARGSFESRWGHMEVCAGQTPLSPSRRLRATTLDLPQEPLRFETSR